MARISPDTDGTVLLQRDLITSADVLVPREMVKLPAMGQLSWATVNLTQGCHQDGKRFWISSTIGATPVRIGSTQGSTVLLPSRCQIVIGLGVRQVLCIDANTDALDVRVGQTGLLR